MYLLMWLKVVCVLHIVNNAIALECYVCHSKQDPSCGDPFQTGHTVSRSSSNNNFNNHNKNFINNNSKIGQMKPIDCERVRRVGAGTVAASQALGGGFFPYVPLDPPPHVCFKLTMGSTYAVRGCSKPDFCQNITESCDLCGGDGCNEGSSLSSLAYLLLTPFVIRYFNI